MKLIKKITALAVAATMLFSLAACVDQNQKNTSSTESTSSVKNTARNGFDDRAIIATSPAVCVILEALGVENVVGVPTSDSYEIPEMYSDATEVGTAMSPDMEIVSSLNPTLIISPQSLEADLASQYEEIGVDSIFMNLTSTAGMYKSIQELGEILNREDEANALVEDFQNFTLEYYNKNKDKEKPTVLILMGLPGSYVVATDDSYVGSLVKLAGGINVYADGDGESFLNINTEDMVEKQPDIILRTAHALPDEVQEMFTEEFSTNDIWQHFTAVQEGKVFDLDYNNFGMSANLDYQDALADLQEIFYGE